MKVIREYKTLLILLCKLTYFCALFSKKSYKYHSFLVRAAPIICFFSLYGAQSYSKKKNVEVHNFRNHFQVASDLLTTANVLAMKYSST